MIFLFVNYFRAANKINMYNFIVAIFKKTNYINNKACSKRCKNCCYGLKSLFRIKIIKAILQ